MSIHSKSRRDARKKKQRPSGADRTGPKLQPHAHLLDGDGKVIGGAGLRGDQWVMVVGGKVITTTDSAGMAIAMLKHVAALREAAGLAVTLSYSTQLRDAATVEAEAVGKTLDEYLDLLEQERVERAESKLSGPVA